MTKPVTVTFTMDVETSNAAFVTPSAREAIVAQLRAVARRMEAGEEAGTLHGLFDRKIGAFALWEVSE